MQKADYLLRLMKQQTDALVAKDEKLQQFLMWVNEKSLSVKVRYKSAAVRAFYFALDRSLELALDRSLERTLDRTLEFALERALDRALVLALDHAIECAPDRALDRALTRTLEPELRQALQHLKEQLPQRDGGKEILKQWWQVSGLVWTEQLRAALIEHRNICHDWQFSEQQEKVLTQYYDANKLLVDCLNSDCKVSPAVRSQIEETLLLPIAEIEKYR